MNPVWPAIIRYAGVDEVTFVHDQAQWNADLELTDFRYTSDDVLIDSQGHVHGFECGQPVGPVSLKATDQRLSPQQLSDAVQKHLSAVNQCCVSKLVFDNYAECFAMLEKTAEK
jgi:hypothetical protein